MVNVNFWVAIRVIKHGGMGGGLPPSDPCPPPGGLSPPSLSSIPSEQLQPLSALFYCKYSALQFWSAVPRVWLCKALYLGSVKI